MSIVAEGERVGRGGHRLGADVLLAGRREHLGHRISLVVVHRDRLPCGRGLEPVRRLEPIERIVPGPLADLTVEPVDLLGLAGGDRVSVEQQVTPHRERDLPLGPGCAGEL